MWRAFHRLWVITRNCSFVDILATNTVLFVDTRKIIQASIDIKDNLYDNENRVFCLSKRNPLEIANVHSLLENPSSFPDHETRNKVHILNTICVRWKEVGAV